ncbi:putative vacuolar protein sorting-associated protein [Podospora fimiseda]|uniref:Vacuolar protein sorting-associated protein n=1 Tax=Podospora fimiseda TaxID=252190 RepID=A0AAN7BME4_9PEZI|nr:putative vacuolar protein sorting-associated protein [Podospora fimiseda]
MTESSPKPGDSETKPDTTSTQTKAKPSHGKPPDKTRSTKTNPSNASTVEQSSDGEDDEDNDEGEDEDEDESETEAGEGDSDDNNSNSSDDKEDDEEDSEEEEDEEPKLKYARLTQHLGPVYRNGDATSAFIVAGDKTILGTHNGNIHVIQLPAFQSLRVYHAHSASVTSLSISPYPPPLSAFKPDVDAPPQSPRRAETMPLHSSAASASRRPREQLNTVPNTPSNNIYIATSSMDGNVCVQNLVDVRDVHLRNFARPIQAVALSPEYKTDKTYLSGGLSGQLILTVGAPTGRSTATTTGAAAQAAGWLGGMVGANTGKDTVLHSGEGTINTIKWSLSGRYVVWLNEHGIKIMRTKLHLDSTDAEDAWKRIGHIDRPQNAEWDTMASVWKGRAEWIDEQAVEPDEPVKEPTKEPTQEVLAPQAAASLKQHSLKYKIVERLLVGWGGTIWIIHVHPGGIGIGKNAGERSAGRAEIVKLLRMDCIISGISLYTQNLVLVLAYCLPDEDEEEEGNASRGHERTLSGGSEPSGGVKRRQNNPPPELRLIDLTSQAEIGMDSLTLSRFERLSSNDYHLGVLPGQTVAATASNKGALETLAGLGTDMLNVALNPISLFGSSASVRSRDSNDSPASSSRMHHAAAAFSRPVRNAVHPNLAKPGIKIFIHSPYDCILATKRDLADHLKWLLDHQQYQQAWELVDEHPEIMVAAPETRPLSPEHTHIMDEFYDDSTSAAEEALRSFYSSAEKEKRRIGELWIQELVEAGNWTRAGQICGKVLGTPDRWEKWVWTFANAHKFDEIVNYIPTERTRPPIPGTIYEVVLGHYLQTSKPRFRDLLERWSPDLFEIMTITTALEDQLKFRDVREDSVEDGEVGRDWRIVMESLAKLHEANGRNREALKCYIKLQDADSAMRLIKDGHLADAVADDIPSFIGLRVPHASKMSQEEREAATSEAITLLVDEAQHGLVKPDVVVSQLQNRKLEVYNLYTFFYLRGLWRGEGIHEHSGESKARLVTDSQSLVDNFADLAVHLFAKYDQSLLMDLLKTSTAYTFEKAVHECEKYSYIPELVYLYSKTGDSKRALYLIIDRLGDVSRAIAFAKEQDDPELWEDLLAYSMDKPRFIRGLLEEVGTAINPITLVRRIPEGLEIEGLREGLKHIMKEHEIQYSISSGVARVLRSEVAAAQNLLRSGQKKGVKFEVVVKGKDHVDVQPKDVPTVVGSEKSAAVDEASMHGGDAPAKPPGAGKKWAPGHCAQCLEPFVEWEMETLVGFACGHVFHLPHLLERLNPGQKVDETLLNGVNGSDGYGYGGSHHLIGPKVNHARLLRDRIAGGCPVCREAEDS